MKRPPHSSSGAVKRTVGQRPPEGAPYAVLTNGRDRSSVKFDAQASFAAQGGFEFLIGYSGQFAGNYQDHAATLGAQICF